MQILLSNSQAGPGRTVKQEQEEMSRNHVQTFIFPSVHFSQLQDSPKNYLLRIKPAVLCYVAQWGATTKYDLENSFNWQKSKLPLPLFGELKLGWALLQWEFGAAGRGHYPDHKLADDLFSTCTWFDIGFHCLPRSC